MDKIDLDAIATKFINVRPHHSKLMVARAAMKEAIHQALVLASEKATLSTIDNMNGFGYEIKVDKQSILDVIDLVV